MPVTLYAAPAGAGKTEFLLGRLLPSDVTYICVPTGLQAQAWRRRLAHRGGALGARVLTFDQLVDTCLHLAGIPYVELSGPVQYRLLRTIIATSPLSHYAALREKPGFIQGVQQRIAEFKAGQIAPADLLGALKAMDPPDPPRLRELALIYARYQDQLQTQQWADRVGRLWLATEELQRAPHVARNWARLVVDGFDDFTQAQLALLRLLTARVDDFILALTLPAEAPDRFRRFEETRRLVEKTFAAAVQPLPNDSDAPTTAPALRHLGRALFMPRAERHPPAPDQLALYAAPNQAAEVRLALRWLKQQIVQRRLQPSEAAVLARDLTPYQPYLQQTAAEFGLPLRLVDGLALGRNPAIAALLALLRLLLPVAQSSDAPGLPRALLLAAWRSPYFDWARAQVSPDAAAVGIGPGDAEKLDVLSRRQRVLQGIEAWRAALTWLIAAAPPHADDADDERADLPPGLPVGGEAQALQAKFERFLAFITPPAGTQPLRDHVAWLEDLLGSLDGAADPVRSLGVVRRAATGPHDLRSRDLAALRALKEVLRSLVWAEEVLPAPVAVSFADFYAELAGAVEAEVYLPAGARQPAALLAADVIQARGLPFRVVALLGLGEGLFPAVITEDPFVRDSDRAFLQEQGLALELSTASDERTFFYETINRPTDALLLTRPRLADNGSTWVPSPFWNEIRRLVDVEPLDLQSAAPPFPAAACSPEELLESATPDTAPAALSWLRQHQPGLVAAAVQAESIVRLREARRATPYDGDLSHMGPTFAARYNQAQPWSASRLESYLACGFYFFVARLLGIEPREEPDEELSARQSGNIYHHVFEKLYADPRLAATVDLPALRALVREVAAPLLDAAPGAEGFRPTAWWAQTQEEMIENVALSVVALRLHDDTFTPLAFEAYFKDLVFARETDAFRLRGLIDRIDRNDVGELRIIDYKLGGPGGYTPRALDEGRRIQLPLYAVAAAEALHLGRVVDGFYWHVRQQAPSPLQLARVGPEAALEKALAHAWQAVDGARAGLFRPTPPAAGCPPYCPAAAFCWHYRPAFYG